MGLFEFLFEKIINHKKMKDVFLGSERITVMACLYEIDLRLRTLGSEDRLDITRRIQASTIADRLFVGTVAGFDECEIVSTKTAFFNYLVFQSLGGIFSKFPVYYALDCLRKHKIAIFSILGGRMKILYIFSQTKIQFLWFQTKCGQRIYPAGQENDFSYRGDMGNF